MKQLASATAPKVLLSITGGPHKGSTYKINSNLITIGRSRDNDISLEKDPKISRKHFKIEFSPKGASIVNLAGKNPLYLNDKQIDNSAIVSGNVIIAGASTFHFEIKKEELPSIRQAGQDLSTHIDPSLQAYSGVAPSSTRRSSRKSKGDADSAKKKRFYTIISIVFGLFLLLMMTDSKDKKPAEGILNDKELETRIESTIEATRKERQQLLKSGKLSSNFKLAQESYITGFRDYERGNFERAVQSFQACLSLYADHILCNRYLNLSQRKHQELIHYYMVQGRKHQSANQFKPCMNDYRNVMIMIKVKSNSLYNEALANFQFCKTRMEGRY